jgi:hypothetical protein
MLSSRKAKAALHPKIRFRYCLRMILYKVRYDFGTREDNLAYPNTDTLLPTKREDDAEATQQWFDAARQITGNETLRYFYFRG